MKTNFTEYKTEMYCAIHPDCELPITKIKHPSKGFGIKLELTPCKACLNEVTMFKQAMNTINNLKAS